MIRNAIIMSLILLISCDSQKKDSDLETRLNKLEQENEKLRKKLSNTPPITYSEPLEPVNSVSQSNFVFVRLVVEQEEFNPEPLQGPLVLSYNYCSSIMEYSAINNDTKYKFMNEVQQNYLRFNHKKPKVKNRECFVFSSYEEASKKREEFLVDKE